MPEAIVNTSPLQYLHQIGHLDLLREFYSKIIVAHSVVEELACGREVGLNVPDPAQFSWMEVRAAPIEILITAVADLGRGEREALSLSQVSPASILILDDLLARNYARDLQLKFTGTLGILARARREERVSALAPLLSRLVKLGFRLSPQVRAEVLASVGEK